MDQKRVERMLAGYRALHDAEMPEWVARRLRLWLENLSAEPEPEAIRRRHERLQAEYERKLATMQWEPGDVAVHEDFGVEVLRAVIGKVERDASGRVLGAEYCLFVSCPCCGTGVNSTGRYTPEQLIRYPRETGRRARQTRRWLEEALVSWWQSGRDEGPGADDYAAELLAPYRLAVPPLDWSAPLPEEPALAPEQRLALAGMVTCQLSDRCGRGIHPRLKERVAEGVRRLAAQFAAHGRLDALHAIEEAEAAAIIGAPHSPFRVGDVIRPVWEADEPLREGSHALVVQEVELEEDRVFLAATECQLLQDGWAVTEWRCNLNSLKPRQCALWLRGADAQAWVEEVVRQIRRRQERHEAETEACRAAVLAFLRDPGSVPLPK